MRMAGWVNIRFQWLRGHTGRLDWLSPAQAHADELAARARRFDTHSMRWASSPQFIALREGHPLGEPVDVAIREAHAGRHVTHLRLHHPHFLQWVTQKGDGRVHRWTWQWLTGSSPGPPCWPFMLAAYNRLPLKTRFATQPWNIGEHGCPKCHVELDTTDHVVLCPHSLSLCTDQNRCLVQTLLSTFPMAWGFLWASWKRLRPQFLPKEKSRGLTLGGQQLRKQLLRGPVAQHTGQVPKGCGGQSTVKIPEAMQFYCGRICCP